MTDDIAPVVPIHPDRDLGDEDAPIATSNPGPVIARCRHERIKLDKDAHRAYCRECEAEVDLFDYVWKLASDWERYARHRKEAYRRAQAAQARLDETLRLERNARARLKKLDPAAKPPAVPWGERSVGW